MNVPRIAAIAAALYATATPTLADDIPAKSKIVAADLFKNGLVVVKREVTLGKPGIYLLDDVPAPVHGTYWIEGAGTVESTLEMRDVEVPAVEAIPGNLQDDLAGTEVAVHLKGDKRAPVIGTIVKLKPPKGEEPAAAPSRYLVLKTRSGRTYVDLADVAAVEAVNAPEKVTRSKPCLKLTLAATDKPETRVAIHYLTRGLAWAPSYRIDITDPKTLSLEQHAAIRNELSDLEGADLKLISGFPGVQYAHVRSPLSPRTTLAAFFQELRQGAGSMAPAMDNSVMTQQVLGNFHAAPLDLGLGAIPTGEGVDLHYQPIGKRTLALGEALELTVARGTAPYERIVEWLVPDTRNEYGQQVRRGRGEAEGESEESASWDALKFKNPLAFPMTTGPAMVTAGGTFSGQHTSYWVNSGEETVLRVNKALSVRTRSIENEQQLKDGAGREPVWVGGRTFRKTTVEGELAASNHRKETVQLVVRRRFSGDLVQAEGSPKTSLREDGVFSINRRNELTWNFPLKPGEERKLKYSYTVLVPH